MSNDPATGGSIPIDKPVCNTPAEIETRTLFVVVHGIGDPISGETIRAFARGITLELGSIELIEETHWVPGPDSVEGDRHSVPAFPVPVLRDRGGNFVLAEVYWGDLSKFPVNLFGLIPGFFAVLFGLRYIAHQAVDGLEIPKAAWLRRLIRIATALLVGPAAATNLLLLFLLAGAVVADHLSVPFDKSPEADNLANLSVLAALIAGILLGWLYRENQLVRLIGVSLSVVACIVLVIIAVEVLSPRSAQSSDQLWGHVGQGFVSYGDAAGLVLGLCFTAVGVIQLATLAVLARMAITHRERPEFTSAGVACSLPFVMTFAWSIIIPIAWATIGAVLPVGADFQAKYREQIERGAPFLDRYFWAIVPFFAVFVGVISWWARRRSRPPLSDDRARLIVNPWLQWGVVAVYVAAGSLTMHLWMRHPSGSGPATERLGPSFLVLITPALGILPVLLSQGSPYLRSALDLVYDVVNHFFFHFSDIDRRVGPDRSPPPFPVRRAIESRLNATFRHFSNRLAGDEGPPWRLVVLSHSQGTVVAISTLNDPVARIDEFHGISLVTMGSPFSHVYQHYFRHHYTLLSDGQWQMLRRRLATSEGELPRWLNIFRIDDYVGRSIDDSVPGLIRNIAIGPRGHVGYWSDREALLHIDSVIGLLPRQPEDGT